MVLTHTCSKCQTTMTVPERFGSRQLKCLECGHPFQMDEDSVLPAPAGAEGPPARTLGSQVPEGNPHGGRGALWVVVAIAVLVVLWMNRYRYDHVQLDDGSRIPIRENRLTSTTELFYGGRWTTSLPPASTGGAPPTSTSKATPAVTPEIPLVPRVSPGEVRMLQEATEAALNQHKQEMAEEARRQAAKEQMQTEEEQRQRQRQTEEKQWQASENKRRALAECLDNAYQDYMRRWNSTCESYGRPRDCMLPSDTSAVYSHDRAAAETECHRMYDVVR
jgi:hypothetical protein